MQMCISYTTIYMTVNIVSILQTVHADATFYLNTSDDREVVSGNATFLK